MRWHHLLEFVALLGCGALLWIGCPSEDDDDAGDDDAGDDDAGDDDAGDDDTGDDDTGDDDTGDDDTSSDADGDGHHVDFDCDDQDASITTVWVNLTAAPGGDGSMEQPFTTVAEGVAAGTGCVLVVGGQYDEMLTISAPVEIRGLTDPAATVIDGGAGDPVFVVEAGASLTLRRLELNNGAAVEGGCVRVDSGGTLILDQVVLDDCEASENGGALWAYQANVTITDSQVVDCLSNNGDGGGFYLDESTLTVDNCYFENMDADKGYGGSMELVETHAVITRTHFVDSDANAGGAIDLFGDGSLSATGVLFEYGRAFTTQANGEGGAIASSGASLQVVNCTFADNLGASGAAIYFQTADPQDTLEIRNSIFYKQDGGALRLDGLIDVPADADIEYNDFFGNKSLVDGQTDPSVFAASNLFVDPAFLAYAGPSDEGNDFHLTTGSPLVDAGDPDAAYDDLDASPADMGCYGGPLPLP